MSKPLRLRIQSSKGQSTVTAGSTQTLKNFLQIPEIGYSPDSGSVIKIKTGFPLHDIDVADLSKTISDCGIVNGDRLIVDVVEAGSKETIESNDQKQTPPTESDKASISSYRLPNNTYLVQRKMAPDNSCFFRSVAQGYYGDSSLALLLRQNVSNYIQQNKKEYSEVILGRPVEEYCDWILWETSWGGGIEAGILSKFLGVRIVTIEVESGAKIDVSEQGLKSFMVLLYDGSHYDLLAQATSYGLGSTAEDTTIFKPFNDNVHSLSTYIEPEKIIKHAQEFAKTLRKTTPLINLENDQTLFFCKDCNTQFKGLLAVNEHADASNHVNFTEVK
ncbi:hypothetical protein WICPIJ_008681 [Wickerhamomyces pijperi]|uniref:Ubiquitin thioesterase OTU n=1 Tax=Wickerhamomyces pijperi TaxID=599730 RepID=A0A9P8PX56_WICPI|nr:hypothetical protein WICPIJ_008681 [Wickerhamomyces pijperi]